MRFSARQVATACGLTALLAGGGAALAARSGGNTIHGCVSKKSGALRVARKCRRRERPLSWNRRGPAGKNGAPGAPGAPGSARAYAWVNGSVSGSSPGASFDATKTKGFTAVSEPSNGFYCLTAPNINPATTAPAVTVIFNSGFAGVPHWARLVPAGVSTCQAGQFGVETTTLNSGSEVPSPNISFTIVVP